MNAYYKKALFAVGISFLLFSVIQFVDKTCFKLLGYTEGLEGANTESNKPLTFLISIFGTTLIVHISIFFILLLIITIILYNFFPRKKKQT